MKRHTNEFGDITLADGRIVQLIQHAYLDNSSAGQAAWFASGYLSTEGRDEETEPTVKVMWESLGADEAEDDADWSSPVSANHYSLGDLPL